MIDIHLKYSIGFFGDYSNIIPTPEILTKLVEAFKNKNLIPSTFQEVSPQGVKPRIRFASANNEWSVHIASSRIDIEKIPIDPSGSNLGDIKEFITEACELLDKILVEFKIKGNRLALITDGLLKEMSTTKLNGIYKKLFKPFNFYKKNQPFEWNYRTAAKSVFDIGRVSEDINVLTTINRVKGNLLAPNSIPSYFDRIQIGFDVNTSNESKNTRFDSKTAKIFYLKAIELRDKIANELEAFLYGK